MTQNEVTDESFCTKISSDVELRQLDSPYIEKIVETLNREVLKDVPEDKIREFVMQTIRKTGPL